MGVVEGLFPGDSRVWGWDEPALGGGGGAGGGEDGEKCVRVLLAGGGVVVDAFPDRCRPLALLCPTLLCGSLNGRRIRFLA